MIAERLLRQRLIDDFPKLAEKVKIGSAGIIPREYLRHAEAKGIIFQYPHFGKNPNIYALQYLAKKGIDVSSYRSRELKKDTVMEADLILTIDRLIKSEVLYFYPETSAKVFTFGSSGYSVGKVQLKTR